MATRATRAASKKPKPSAGRKPAGKSKPPARRKAGEKPAPDLAEVLRWLEKRGTQRDRDAMARYAIPSDHAFGVPFGVLKGHAKKLGQSHELAAALWDSGFYEARVLAAFVDEPQRVTPAQMDAWCAGFDDWGTCDTVCFVLFDRTPHAFAKVRQWSRRRPEFQKRAAFALLWGLTVHDKRSGDEPFLEALPLIERAAEDDRHYVKKGVNMALRAVGKRSSRLRVAASDVARRLAASEHASARWIGKDALRELTK